jgi:2-oxoglutarate ferredoxin oxidoreductase subunit gamma
MEEKIIIAGFGGQGVVLAGNVIAQTALATNKNVAAMVSYGAEVRGGTANCTVIISDREIASPVVDNPSIAIILNEPSLDKYEDRVETNGLIILNSSLVKRDLVRKDVKVLRIKATDLADDLGNSKVANLILLGAFIKKTKIFTLDKVLEILPISFPKSKQNLIEINKKALLEGAKLCS